LAGSSVESAVESFDIDSRTSLSLPLSARRLPLLLATDCGISRAGGS